MKKRRIVALIPLAMKLSIVQLCILVFAFSSSAKEVSAQEILNKTISLSVERARLKSVLHEIQYLTDVQFIFSSSMIDVNRKISVFANNKKLGDLLNEISLPLNLGYRVIDGQIILFSNPSHLEIAGNVTIHGVISDEFGMPLAGATVRVKGTNLSTLTDQKGVYVLEQVDEKATLVVSYVGYNSSEFTVNGKSEFNVTLQENAMSLNSVV
ncbi:MAG TPA: carboxypeptidase-like regulatory domain-containing protein, partial [Puia sp.]